MGSKRWRTIWDAAPHCAGHGRWEPSFKVLFLQVSFYSEYNKWQDRSINSNFCSTKIDKRFFINLILFFLPLSGTAYGTFPPLVTRNEEPDEEREKQRSVYDQVTSITHLTTLITTMNLPPRNRTRSWTKLESLDFGNSDSLFSSGFPALSVGPSSFLGVSQVSVWSVIVYVGFTKTFHKW